MSTDDFRALDEAYRETVMLPCPDSLTGALARAREGYEHLLEARERLRFSAWLNSIRERQEFLESEATCAWGRVVVRSGLATFKGEGGAM